MGHSKASIPLRDAIRTLIPSEKWTALLELVGGSVDNAVSSLSGELAGRLFLDAEIAANSIYADSERSRLRHFETLRVAIVNCLEARRRGGALVLKGYTAVSPTRPFTISPDLPLKYHFSNGTVWSGEFKFHGVTVCLRADRPVKPGVSPRSPAVSDAELKDFCKGWLGDQSPTPAEDALWDEAKKAFPNNHVTRARVRTLHRELVPPHLRRSGPRKKFEQTAMAPSRHKT